MNRESSNWITSACRIIGAVAGIGAVVLILKGFGDENDILLAAGFGGMVSSVLIMAVGEIVETLADSNVHLNSIANSLSKAKIKGNRSGEEKT